ncbi:Probable lipoprotein precursor [Flavobacterium indicum GPTSA100-9 = DSM 17447]|uniref:Probable lipoprotein n=1 Tax=Flavobacterium indicum (strain DSM 17447 / CIP 109464 / GPTSA100-9) TaxID=1094466 RepID=H8XQU5_FLAIG|nr:CAP domain-containing protein [Flavobacterium indicum]CCG53393.1 Probable lipoprotein precursor [Flavobacterium indicum GPTSA100-9 = DSM 17447]
MKKSVVTKILAVLIIATSLISCSSSTESVDEPTTSNFPVSSYTQSTFELELLDLVNEYRVSKGLNALSIIEQISFVSSGHTDYMISTQEISHANFETRKENLHATVGALNVGENVAFGYSSAQATLNAWIASESHRLNMESNYTHFGLSVKQDAQGKKYYTMMFIRK